MVAISELRRNLRSYRLQVEQGKVLSVEYYGELIAYLIPLEIAKSLNCPAEKAMTLNSLEFREALSESWHQLLRQKDLIWLKYHEREALAFVSARIYNPAPSDF